MTLKSFATLVAEAAELRDLAARSINPHLATLYLEMAAQRETEAQAIRDDAAAAWVD